MASLKQEEVPHLGRKHPAEDGEHLGADGHIAEGKAGMRGTGSRGFSLPFIPGRLSPTKPLSRPKEVVADGDIHTVREGACHADPLTLCPAGQELSWLLALP